MTKIEVGDFVKVDYDMFANDTLVQTTNEKKGKDAKLQNKSFGSVTMIVGKNFLLKSLDDAILKKNKDSLKLSIEDAYGKKDKKMIRTFPKSTFEQHKMRPVVGITYDFNGMFGTVKAITGGRIMVDFNNPLAGKEIKLDYDVSEKIEDMSEKVSFVIETILKLPSKLFEVSTDKLKVTVKGPKQLVGIKDKLSATFAEFIFEFNDYELIVEEKEIKVKK